MMDVELAIRTVKKEVRRFKTPYVTEVATRKDPFKVLISCIISLRTKDSTTRDASSRLFAIAETPGAVAGLPVKKVEDAIYPAGFYRVKARVIINISKELVEKYGSKVPDTIEGLLALKGVGRKTANLVVTMGYGKPGICVDTHVHRIFNRWGFVKTKTPEATEMRLREKLARRHWIEINDLLVTWGQNVCKPVLPLCSLCKLDQVCPKTGVKRAR